MIEINKVDSALITQIEDCLEYKTKIFQTSNWLNFIKKNKKADVVLIEIKKEGICVGYLVGLQFKSFGIKIFASPFEGWGTSEMGFIMKEGYSAEEFIKPVSEYLFKQQKIKYIEIVDEDIDISKITWKKIKKSIKKDYVLDITADEDLIFQGFKKDVRKSIRQFERKGGTIIQVPPDEEFAKTFYNQLVEVFKKQNLKPNYDLQRVIDLLNAFKGSECIACFEAINAEGLCIASTIYFGYGDNCYSWGSASLTAYQYFRPNEALRWHALKYWKNKGCKRLYMCGIREYKKKFNPITIDRVHLIIAKFRILIILKNMAKFLIKTKRKLSGVRHEK